MRTIQTRKYKENKKEPDRKSIRREGDLLHTEYTGGFIPGLGNILEQSLHRSWRVKRIPGFCPGESFHF